MYARSAPVGDEAHICGNRRPFGFPGASYPL